MTKSELFINVWICTLIFSSCTQTQALEKYSQLLDSPEIALMTTMAIPKSKDIACFPTSTFHVNEAGTANVTEILISIPQNSGNFMSNDGFRQLTYYLAQLMAFCRHISVFYSLLLCLQFSKWNILTETRATLPIFHPMTRVQATSKRNVLTETHATFEIFHHTTRDHTTTTRDSVRASKR